MSLGTRKRVAKKRRAKSRRRWNRDVINLLCSAAIRYQELTSFPWRWLSVDQVAIK